MGRSSLTSLISSEDFSSLESKRSNSQVLFSRLTVHAEKGVYQSDDQSACLSVSSSSARPNVGRYLPKFNSKSLGTP